MLPSQKKTWEKDKITTRISKYYESQFFSLVFIFLISFLAKWLFLLFCCQKMSKEEKSFLCQQSKKWNKSKLVLQIRYITDAAVFAP